MSKAVALIESDPAMDAAPARHAACGFVIHAHYPLHALPRCDAHEGPLGVAVLREGDVPEHLGASALIRPALEVSPEAVLVKPRVEGRSIGRILIRGGNEIIVAPEPGFEQQLELFILGSGIGAICMQKGVLPIHASAVAIGNQAIAFAGPSGAGKSTTAAAVAARGHDHVTDDIAALRVPRDARPLLYPGTMTMKLSPASSDALGLDGAAAQAVPGHIKRRFDSAPPPRGPWNLAAIYFLATDERDEIVIEPLTGIRAVAAIGREVYRRHWLQPMGLLEARLQDIADVARHSRCFRLTRPDSFERLPELVDAVIAHHAALERDRT